MEINRIIRVKKRKQRAVTKNFQNRNLGADQNQRRKKTKRKKRKIRKKRKNQRVKKRKGKKI